MLRERRSLKSAVILQDLNPASPGYGDMLWLALGVYRNDTPTRLDTDDCIIDGDVGPDGGLGKLIYQSRFDAFHRS